MWLLAIVHDVLSAGAWLAIITNPGRFITYNSNAGRPARSQLPCSAGQRAAGSGRGHGEADILPAGLCELHQRSASGLMIQIASRIQGSEIMNNLTSETPSVPGKSHARENVDKIRWSLRQRLCEHMRRLNADLFDELDDFLFSSVQPEELAEGSTQLRVIREFRNKKQVFEEKFLASINAALQSTLVPARGVGPLAGVEVAAGGSAYEKMEVDLALERMQRKAFKFYAGRIKQLAACGEPEAPTAADCLIPENRDILIGNTLRALAQAHNVFRVSLESRLIFLKLFERHFLLEMDRLYQDVISIVSNQDNQQFVARLYASSTSIYRKRTKSQIRSSAQQAGQQIADEDPPASEQVAEKVQQLVDAWCRQEGVPGFVANMLRGEWSNVLLLAGLNKGVETSEWSEARKTAESLLQWLSATDQAGSQSIDLEELRERLRDGFALTHKDPQAQSEFFKALSDHAGFRAELAREVTSVAEESGTRPPVRQSAVSFVAVSEAGRKILDNNDLDDFIALLSDEQEQAIAEVEEEAISMDYYLNMVDTMADDAAAQITQNGHSQPCRIQKSSAIDNSYQVIDEQGQVLLTRGRVGLAVSLRSGEVRLAGQVDFKSKPAGGGPALTASRPLTGALTTH